MMCEIGGYIELDSYSLPMLHEGAIELNCGRNSLAYLLRARKIKKLYIPKFICDSVTVLCEREGVPYTPYSIGLDFLPAEKIVLGTGEWLYLVNYYSQVSNEQILEFAKRYKRLIVDNAQSYFQMPISGVDTIYTCRKYFGVSDGSFLYTDAIIDEEFPLDESFERMRFLLGRFERTASEFYDEYVKNNELFVNEPIKRMSKLTRNLLHAIDYNHVKFVREQNFQYLHKSFKAINGLKLRNTSGTFMYPLLLTNGNAVRKELLKRKIYIPTLWPNVFEWCAEEEICFFMAENILPIPIDQRYSIKDLDEIIDMIFEMQK